MLYIVSAVTVHIRQASSLSNWGLMPPSSDIVVPAICVIRGIDQVVRPRFFQRNVPSSVFMHSFYGWEGRMITMI